MRLLPVGRIDPETGEIVLLGRMASVPAVETIEVEKIDEERQEWARHHAGSFKPGVMDRLAADCRRNTLEDLRE